MGSKNVQATILAVTFVFSAIPNRSQGLINRTEEAISSVASDAKNLIPSCVFGVQSISYVLYTRDHLSGILVKTDDEEIPLRENQSVAFFVHGFVAEANSSSYFELSLTWLEKEDINIFSVDWDKASCYDGLNFSDFLAYGSAVDNVPVVGEDVANFTVRLARDFGVNVSDITFIGHSLGAHVSGFAGKTVQQITEWKYKLILGLDPAGILFSLVGCDKRLCKSDAAFVQIFHTSLVEGLRAAIGDDDFYFHGGFNQPACGVTPFCDHSISVTYAMMAIMYPECFLGRHWELALENILDYANCSESNCAYAGLQAPQEPATGIFYVSPTAKEPYCSGN